MRLSPRWLAWATVLGLPGLVLGFAALLGAGMLREVSPVLVVTGALALLVLPGLGLGALARSRRGAGAVGLAVWGWVVVVGFPIYFPGERVGALAAGAAVMTAPFGWSPPPALVYGADALLPAFGAGRSPATPVGPTPVALPARVASIRAPDRADAVAFDGDDAVVLPYEGEGRSLRVPVELEGEDGEVREVWMIFDTGASVSTLDRATLDSLSLSVQDDAPRVQFNTANGTREAPLILVPRAWLGGFEVAPVTVSECASCANDGAVGLLGLNVAGAFLVTVDQTRKELILRPRPNADDSDVGLWLELDARASTWADGRTEVELHVVNPAPHDVASVQLEVGCDEAYEATLTDIPAGGRATSRVSLPLGADCSSYTVKVVSGRWAS